MTVTWGNASGHLQVGIDAWTSTPTHSSTSVTVNLRVYVRVADSNWDYDDDENFSISGPDGGSGTFHNSLSGTGAQMTIWSKQFTQSISYSGGPTLTWSCQISGMYNGGTPFHSHSLTLPARPASTPTAPGGVVATGIQATQATLSWNAASDEGAAIDDYQAHISTSSSFSPTIYGVTGSGSIRSYTYTGLAKGTTYYTKVQAHNRLGWGSLSPVGSFKTATTAPSAPGTPTFSGTSFDRTTINWSAPTDNGGLAISSYTVQLATDSGFSSIAKSASGVTGTSWQVTGLAPHTQYWVRVSATNATGTSANSAAGTVTTAGSPPSAPAAPTIADRNPTDETVTWTVPGDDGGLPITGYDVQWDDDPDFSSASLVSLGDVLEYHAVNLKPSTLYWVRVRAKNSAGAGAWSPATPGRTTSGLRISEDGTEWVEADVWVPVQVAGGGYTWVQGGINILAGSS